MLTLVSQLTRVKDEARKGHARLNLDRETLSEKNGKFLVLIQNLAKGLKESKTIHTVLTTVS